MVHPIASDLSFECLQRRTRLRESLPEIVNNQHLPLHLLPSQVAQREAFIADRQAIPDSFQGDMALIRLYYGRKG